MTFDVVFGVFVAAMAVIAALTVRWAIGRGREANRLKNETSDGGQAGS